MAAKPPKPPPFIHLPKGEPRADHDDSKLREFQKQVEEDIARARQAPAPKAPKDEPPKK